MPDQDTNQKHSAQIEKPTTKERILKGEFSFETVNWTSGATPKMWNSRKYYKP